MYGIDNLYAEMQYALQKGNIAVAKQRAKAIKRLYYSRKLYRYPIILGYKNTEELKEAMAPYTSVVLRSDCEDLSAILEENKYIHLDMAEYREKLKGVTNDKHILVLQQLLHTPDRMNALEEELDGCCIVWCSFVKEIEDLKNHLVNRRVDTLYGKTKNRMEVVQRFGKETDILIAQPQAGGEGIDLSAAEKIIWYSHPLKAVVQRQANERATKQNKESVVIVRIIAIGSLDEYLVDMLNRKTSLADDIARYGLRTILDRL